MMDERGQTGSMGTVLTAMVVAGILLAGCVRHQQDRPVGNDSGEGRAQGTVTTSADQGATAAAPEPSGEALPPSPTSPPSGSEGQPGPLARPEAVEADEGAVQLLVRGTNSLAFSLYERLRSRPGNIAFSPASIELALTMTWAGAQGETARQMARVLGLPTGEASRAVHDAAAQTLRAWNDPERRTYELRVVNRLFGQQGMAFRQEFLDLTRRSYGAPLERLDFLGGPEPSRARINQWVAEQTNDRIRDLLPPGSINALSRLVLVNAVYFLGHWTRAFDATATRDETFYADGTRHVTVPMMHRTDRYRFGHIDGAQVLELAYEGGDFAMIVILPEERGGLPALESRMSPELFGRAVASLGEQRVDVSLPRFRIDFGTVPLKDELRGLGMTLPFTDQADFGLMTESQAPDQRLFISNVYHKAFVQVDESGTEAAAATGVVMRVRGRAPHAEVAVFRADHPFIFAIRDVHSGAVLFLGRLTQPAS